MRVLIVNTSEKTGGAAVAANRLMEALNNNGEKARMLVRDKDTGDINVSEVPRRLLRKWTFIFERLIIFVRTFFRREHLFEIDIANSGYDITKTKEFREADVIHLHWVNQGLLSLGGVRKILDSGKAVVWTMHDLWPATAICHYAGTCMRFKSRCHHCPLLPAGGHDNDLSARVWRRKQRCYEGRNVQFVTCSRWLGGEARQSALLRGQDITCIPNAIDTRVFRPKDKAEARKAVGIGAVGNVILFVSQKVTDERKGMHYFIEAVRMLVGQHPEMRENTAIAVLGGHSEDIVREIPLTTFPLGYISDDEAIVNVYSSADVFVLPSMQDNLPNTVMEAMACGVPCVGFKEGGIPEMIDHLTTGYVAAPADAADLAKGIWYVLNEADRDALRQNALRKVSARYSQRAVALKYIEVYNKAIAYKRYKI